MRNCFYSYLLTLGVACFADPMNDLDSFLGCSPLSQSFQQGDEVVFRNESCFGTTCEAWETKTHVSVESPSRVVIRSVGTDGKVFQEEGLTEERWAKVRCNRARLHVEGMESSGFQVQLSELRVSKRLVSVNGQLTEVETRAIDIRGSNRLGMKINHTLELAREMGGLAQMVVREQRSGTSGVDRFTVITAKY